ncbi:MAG: M24 family metallopeptidase [Maioricimonas sp. JB049]
MLTHEGCLARRQRLWERVPESTDWVLVADPRHVQYLANCWVQPLSFSGGERCWLLLERSGRATVMGDNFALRSAVHEPVADREIVETWYDHRHSVINRDHALLNALRKVADELNGRPGLVEAEWLPAAAVDFLPLDGEAWSLDAGDRPAQDGSNGTGALDLGTLIRSLRRQKEQDEVELLRTCMRAGDAGQQRLREVLAAGLTEFEIYREIQQAAVAAAGRPALVYGDFRASTPEQPKAGGLPTDYELKSGDLFVLDYSVLLDGYRSDFTNTLCIGAPTDEQQMLFELCDSAMRAGEESLKAGAAAKDVYAAVAAPFQDAGYGNAFPHHAGHGIGLAHPEPPILVPESRDVLLAGDVVTLEPGAYVEGIGGMRIEHNYLITESGYERLSNHVISLT